MFLFLFFVSFCFVLFWFLFFSFSVFEFYWGCDALQCKAGWQEWNGACYKFSSTLVPYSDASAACKNDEANLVSIHSPEENEFVRSLTGGSDIFIGLNDSKTEGTFVWSDGSTVTYANWELGEPDDGYNMSDCVVLLGSSDGKWNDTPCIMWNEYVCKFTRAQAFQARGKLICCGLLGKPEKGLNVV